jgi:hypothetical protein
MSHPTCTVELVPTDRPLEVLMPDPAYHTDSPEYSHREVHHNNNDCPNGKQIKPEHRKSGTGGKPLCEHC